MKTKTKKPLSKNDNFQFRVVYALLQYLFRMGVAAKELEDLTSRAFLELKKNARPARLSNSVGFTDAAKLATAIQRWYRDRSLVDFDGKPIALRLLGPAPSVEWLIKREKLGSDSASFTRNLVKLKVLKRCRNGKFLPTGRHLIVRNHHPFLAEHHARSVIRLLNTARSNVLAKSPLEFLIERCADVPCLPRRKLRAFRDFTNQQGEAFIDTVNDWLETNNVVSNKKRATQAKEAGIHVFAFYGGEP
jgi:hypothetical protein